MFSRPGMLMRPGNWCWFLNLVVVSVRPSTAWFIWLATILYSSHPASPNPPAISCYKLAFFSLISSFAFQALVKPTTALLCSRGSQV